MLPTRAALTRAQLLLFAKANVKRQCIQAGPTLSTTSLHAAVPLVTVASRIDSSVSLWSCTACTARQVSNSSAAGLWDSGATP